MVNNVILPIVYIYAASGITINNINPTDNDIVHQNEKVFRY